MISKELNCTAYGSMMEFKDNTCTGKTKHFYNGHGKLAIINNILKEKNITNPNIIIFGNDENDYEMLQMGNVNYIINPSSKLLLKLKNVNLKYNKIII